MENVELVEIKQEPFEEDEDEISETEEESVSIKNKSVKNEHETLSETKSCDKVNKDNKLIEDEEKSADRNESAVKGPDPMVNSTIKLKQTICKEKDPLPSTSKVNDSTTTGDSDEKQKEIDAVIKPEEVNFELIKVEPDLLEDESVNSNDITDDDNEFSEVNPAIKENEFVSDEDEEMSCDWNEPTESERDPLALDSVLQIDIKTECPSDEETTYITSESASTSKADDVVCFCQKCGLGFSTWAQNEEHSKTCLESGEPINCDSFIDKSRRKNKPKVPTRERRFKCSLCNYAFGASHHLANHFRTHTGEKPFKCSVCDYCTISPYNLSNHIRTHTGERPYKCSLCDFAAITSFNLKKHIRIHTGEKPYKCTLCDYSASVSWHMKRHMRVHSGERPYGCTECNYAGATPSALRKHMKVHSNKMLTI